MLTLKRIEKLASKKGVDKTAVENFLGTVGLNPDSMSAYMNLKDDAKSYKWNSATVNAIRIGITEFFKRT